MKEDGLHCCFQDMIVRDALGELLGFVFVPLALAGIYSILFKDKKY